jgi:excinuclease ABC subunit A
MQEKKIIIRGAREHNLKSVNLEIPRNKLIVFTGVSGSGKSSLAFDTLYAEGQRRYVESLSAYARQFLGQMERPEVDFIEGLSPAISIEQKTVSRNPRSTVATITEIYDYMRVLFARIGTPHCTQCGREVEAQATDEIIDKILQLPEGKRIQIMAPIAREQKGEYKDDFEAAMKAGYARARVDGQIYDLTDDIKLDRNMRHNIEIVVDRIIMQEGIRGRLAESVEAALELGEGTIIVNVLDNVERTVSSLTGDILFNQNYACPVCGISYEALTPQMFSFNSPQGMCPSCKGLGVKMEMSPNLVVPDKSRSIREGAIALIGEPRNLWIKHILAGLAEHYGFSLDAPWSELTEEQRNAVLYGTGGKRIQLTYISHDGRKWPRKDRYDGIIPTHERKFRNCSEGMREYLSKFFATIPCQECNGGKLRKESMAVTIANNSIVDIVRMSIDKAADFFDMLPSQLTETQLFIGEELIKEIRGRLEFLKNVGLNYLTLDRTAPTLSGGEAQRIRLASQIGSGLVGVLYILDEPTIGLHSRDNIRLLNALKQLRDRGNTVIVVEHDEETMRSGDLIVDFGPGPGVKGGQVVAVGTPYEISRNENSITGKYLSGELMIPIPEKRRPTNDKWLKIIGARHNNLKNIDVEIPIGLFISVTGVSGSGKSSLINDILHQALAGKLMRAYTNPGEYDRIEGIEHLKKVIDIDQSPIGRTPRSNPATYVKVFDTIRNLYAQLPESKVRGYKPGRFSFNVKGGRCEACQGDGMKEIQMHFLPNVWVKCEVCGGARYNDETLQVKYKGKSIADVLDMDIQEALEHFENMPGIARILKTLHDVGLDYIKLGQPAPTLSGGEAQRIKLAKELCRVSTGKTIYILDEPTTGMHFADTQKLLDVLNRLVDAGNTVVVIEHNMEVIKMADYVIDLGPEGGDQGGWLVATGTPEEVAKVENSYTGQVIKEVLSNGGRKKILEADYLTQLPSHPTTHLKVRGAKEHNLKSVDVDIPLSKMTVLTGVSGSGKTSLALDTIYAEGQRRYVESLSSYARQFLGQMPKPHVDFISGLAPAVAIEQKPASKSPRSTVGTVTEIYDYMRVLFARIGTPHCYKCGREISTQTAQQIVDRIMARGQGGKEARRQEGKKARGQEGKKAKRQDGKTVRGQEGEEAGGQEGMESPEGIRAYIMSPIKLERGEDYETILKRAFKAGFARAWVDGQLIDLKNEIEIDRRRQHDVAIIVDRLVISQDNRSRLTEAVETALSTEHSDHKVLVEFFPPSETVEQAASLFTAEKDARTLQMFSEEFACVECGISFDEITPQSFSFNNPAGMCPDCNGLGITLAANPDLIILDKEKSIRDGAILPWGAIKPSDPFSRYLEALAEHYGFSLEQPFGELAEQHQNIILYGVEQTVSLLHDQSPSLLFKFRGVASSLEWAYERERYRRECGPYMKNVPCPKCGGGRLRPESVAVTINGKSIIDIIEMPISQAAMFFSELQLTPRQEEISGEVLKEIRSRLQFLVDVGLEYLTLNRSAPTLSGGEAERIRLASQLGCGLAGVLYVLDEPTVGLHQRDNHRLLKALRNLKDLGNSVIVVEHDRDTIMTSDHILDFGPGAGVMGGQLVAFGSPEQVKTGNNSLTAQYLTGKLNISASTSRRTPNEKYLEIVGARHNNLKNIDVKIPLGVFTCITGVSGSGKSSLIDDILYKSLARTLHRAHSHPGDHDAIKGLEYINKVINIDQNPIGDTPRSNPVTYIGAFSEIRTLYTALPDAKVRGFNSKRFSFNMKEGRCEACWGNGYRRIEMHFLADVWVKCDVCNGTRYKKEILDVKYKGQSIADVLEMTAPEALEIFQNVPKIKNYLQMLCDVGLDYLKLGQSATTLSGGEAQRVKLAKELARPSTGKTIYLLDEPTTGLHFADIQKLLNVLNRLVDKGNTVVVIEHNLDVIKNADYIIDLGPEGGDEGGQVVAYGTPEEIAQVEASYTGRFIRDVLKPVNQFTG